jgi:hypothetical protein
MMRKNKHLYDFSMTHFKQCKCKTYIYIYIYKLWFYLSRGGFNKVFDDGPIANKIKLSFRMHKQSINMDLQEDMVTKGI